MPVVVLAGGLGTRIRHLLGEQPKPLADVAGRPFLEWVLRYLSAQGVRRVILSTGFGAAQIQHFADRLDAPGLEIQCVPEPKPLGTAGGFLNAIDAAGDDWAQALVLNGDSLVLTPLAPLVDATGSRGDGALFGLRVGDAARYGSLETDAGGWLRSFAEKRPGAGTINAGVYLLPRAAVDLLPRNKLTLSFEFDVFPQMLQLGSRVRVVECEGPFLDIGTEATLHEAGRFITDNAAWFPPFEALA